MSGRCCKLFLITLTEEEYRSGKFKLQFAEHDFIEDFKLAEEAGANILEQQPDGSCVYLKDNKCSIHMGRPHACRQFFFLDPTSSMILIQ